VNWSGIFGNSHFYGTVDITFWSLIEINILTNEGLCHIRDTFFYWPYAEQLPLTSHRCRSYGDRPKVSEIGLWNHLSHIWHISSYRGAMSRHIPRSYPGLLLQPSGRLIVQWRLQNESQRIYELLTDLEKKVHLPPISPIPSWVSNKGRFFLYPKKSIKYSLNRD
jgi:hypothetical protein